MSSKPSGGLLALIWAVLLTCTPVRHSHAYCWEPGKNPSFTGPPVVEQVDIRTVRVSWFGLVAQRNCADQFLVKYWQKNAPQGYKTTELVPNDTDFILIEVTPKVDYQFQAVAREDKGIIGGIDWNKSPTADFKTSQYNSEVNPTAGVDDAILPVRKTSEPVKDSAAANADQLQPKVDKSESGETPILSIELIVIIAVCGVVLLLIIFGLVYKVACAKKSDEDEDDDDFEDNDEKEKLEV